VLNAPLFLWVVGKFENCGGPPEKIFRMEGSRKFEIRGGGGKIKKRKKKFGPYRRITHTQ
jgi:hypothetical protein